jgi:hypothetical protein
MGRRGQLLDVRGIGIRFVWVEDDGFEQTDDHSPPGYKAWTN